MRYDLAKGRGQRKYVDLTHEGQPSAEEPTADSDDDLPDLGPDSEDEEMADNRGVTGGTSRGAGQPLASVDESLPLEDERIQPRRPTPESELLPPPVPQRRRVDTDSISNTDVSESTPAAARCTRRASCIG